MSKAQHDIFLCRCWCSSPTAPCSAGFAGEEHPAKANDRNTKNGVQSTRTLRLGWLCNGVYFPGECAPSVSGKCDGKEKTGGEEGVRDFFGTKR